MGTGSDDEVLSDRRAIEAIIGRSLDDDEWPTTALPPGTRVRVIKDSACDGTWREVFLGTIDRALPPQLVQKRVANAGELEYSVDFDVLQLDAAGAGPYRKAVRWDRYLETL
ncbi:hypothetical protein [Jatrophihabitans sp.]|uniref:hypothetical protein n=1 Tax=Jatrophihabitans sp. TaxID=1932789 RepID=UPI0030C77962|nr:ferrous iron transport protein [Jatrophihabitans sp.]